MYGIFVYMPLKLNMNKARVISYPLNICLYACTSERVVISLPPSYALPIYEQQHLSSSISEIDRPPTTTTPIGHSIIPYHNSSSTLVYHLHKRRSLSSTRSVPIQFCTPSQTETLKQATVYTLYMYVWMSLGIPEICRCLVSCTRWGGETGRAGATVGEGNILESDTLSLYFLRPSVILWEWLITLD